MAFYERLMINDKDKVFVPINIEGGKTVKSSSFWNTTKSFIIGAAIAIFLFVLFLIQEYPTAVRIGICIGYWFLFFFIVVRQFLIEERYYKKSYIRRKKYETTTSGINWGIIFSNETPLGTSVGYIDGYIGCFVRLERGSIIGQPEDYIDRSLDCYSECLKTLIRKGYLMTIINTSESAGKDKRLIDLSETIKEEHNKALRNLLIYDMAYMKEKAEKTSYETDTILIYTNNYLLLNSIIEDSLEATQLLLQGAYRNRYILNENEILDLHKELNGVNFMDIVASKVDMFEQEAKSTRNLYISAFKLNDGNIIQLDLAQQKELDKIYNEYFTNGKKYEGEDIIQRLIKVRTKLQVENLDDTEIKHKKEDNLESESADLDLTEEKPKEIKKKSNKKPLPSLKKAPKVIKEEEKLTTDDKQNEMLEEINF